MLSKGRDLALWLHSGSFPRYTEGEVTTAADSLCGDSATLAISELRASGIIERRGNVASLTLRHDGSLNLPEVIHGAFFEVHRERLAEVLRQDVSGKTEGKTEIEKKGKETPLPRNHNVIKLINRIRTEENQGKSPKKRDLAREIADGNEAEMENILKQEREYRKKNKSGK